MPIPAALARRLIAGAGADSTEDAGVDAGVDGPTRRRAGVWVRCLYASPDVRDLVAMDSRRREFDGLLRRMLVLRDQTCRTPYCGAPVRHADHVRARRVGGPTSLANAAGLCERCNHAKEVPGGVARTTSPSAAASHEIEVTTPTGHTYRSTAPPLVGAPRGQVRRRCGLRRPLRIDTHTGRGVDWAALPAEEG